MLRAFVNLLLGSLAAPVIYVALGLAYPAGFNNLRGASVLVVLTVFAVAWVWSLVPTIAIGGLTWRTLHARRVDGFISYSAVAIAASGLVAAISSVGIRSFLITAGFAVANAILVRIVELARGRSDTRSNTTPHADARDTSSDLDSPAARAGGRAR